MRATSMKPVLGLVGFAAYLLCGGTLHSANAESPVPLAIVVAKNSPITNLSMHELKQLYLGEFITGPDGKRLIPLNQTIQSRDRLAFDAAVLGMSIEQQAEYWIDRRIRGMSGSPRAVDSGDLAQRIIARLDGAITYLPASAVRPDVKIVRVDGKLPTHPDYRIR
jgi:hypothetical protein